jgi:hypothetical protein
MSNKRLTLNMLMTFSLRGEKKKEKVLYFLLFCVFYPGCGRIYYAKLAHKGREVVEMIIA